MQLEFHGVSQCYNYQVTNPEGVVLKYCRDDSLEGQWWKHLEDDSWVPAYDADKAKLESCHQKVMAKAKELNKGDLFEQIKAIVDN